MSARHKMAFATDLRGEIVIGVTKSSFGFCCQCWLLSEAEVASLVLLSPCSGKQKKKAPRARFFLDKNLRMADPQMGKLISSYGFPK